jgi:DNA-binding MarR family transcriptional regulator
MLVRMATSDAEFQAAWERFGAAVRRARARHDETEQAMTIPQYLLVECLADGDARSVRELAEHASISQPTASRMLDGLERDGLVERRPCATDRRRVQIALTGPGRTALEAQRRLVDAKRRHMLESFAPDEREQIARLLHRMAEAIEGS